MFAKSVPAAAIIRAVDTKRGRYKMHDRFNWHQPCEAESMAVNPPEFGR
jgi:hypothetical protein